MKNKMMIKIKISERNNEYDFVAAILILYMDKSRIKLAFNPKILEYEVDILDNKLIEMTGFYYFNDKNSVTTETDSCDWINTENLNMIHLKLYDDKLRVIRKYSK